MSENQNNPQARKLTDVQKMRMFLATYEAMNEEQKAARIEQHEAVLQSCVQMFEMTTGYTGVEVSLEGRWGKDELTYRARYGDISRAFGVDRRFPFEIQLQQINRGLWFIQRECKDREIERELEEMLNQGAKDIEKA
ncbi:hypothetical protein AB0284_20170 [Pseudarthrobacter phenanthrenivorans]|uniref:hypothetical protein n=1 Tax=Pseudarthrobacter phenanthrenivorans TaxID=361575 RepID=UPI00344B6EC8